MIPIEVGEPTIQRQMFDLTLNEKSLVVNLDLVSELRDKSKIWEIACKLRVSRRYNTKVRPRSFQKEDLVWRMRNDMRKSEGKFSANWEGPFRVREVAKGGVYNLEWLSSKIVSRTRNATHLKFYYSWKKWNHTLFPHPTREVLTRRFSQTTSTALLQNLGSVWMKP